MIPGIGSGAQLSTSSTATSGGNNTVTGPVLNLGSGKKGAEAMASYAAYAVVAIVVLVIVAVAVRGR